MAPFITAFVIGFVGSFHCVAMCGAIAMRVGARGSRQLLVRQLVYHFGRILSYSVLAAVLSMASVAAVLNSGQNLVSIIIGTVLFVASVLILLDIISTDHLMGSIARILGKMRSVLLRHHAPQGPFSALAVGVVNGLLPCGFVYMAIAGSLMQHSVIESMGFMIFFGLGTVPSLVALAFITRIPSIHTWFGSRRVVSIATAIAGLLLVIRGLSLGIPYLSPSLPVGVQTLSDIKHETVCGSPQSR